MYIRSFKLICQSLLKKVWKTRKDGHCYSIIWPFLKQAYKKGIWSPKYLLISSISVCCTSLSPLWSLYNICSSIDVHNRPLSSSMELITAWKASSLRVGFCYIEAVSTDLGAMKSGSQSVWYRVPAACNSQHQALYVQLHGPNCHLVLHTLLRWLHLATCHSV